MSPLSSTVRLPSAYNFYNLTRKLSPDFSNSWHFWGEALRWHDRLGTALLFAFERCRLQNSERRRGTARRGDPTRQITEAANWSSSDAVAHFRWGSRSEWRERERKRRQLSKTLRGAKAKAWKSRHSSLSFRLQRRAKSRRWNAEIPNSRDEKELRKKLLLVCCEQINQKLKATH